MAFNVSLGTPNVSLPPVLAAETGCFYRIWSKINHAAAVDFAQAIGMEIPQKAACGFLRNWNGKRGFRRLAAKMRPF